MCCPLSNEVMAQSVNHCPSVLVHQFAETENRNGTFVFYV